MANLRPLSGSSFSPPPAPTQTGEKSAFQTNLSSPAQLFGSDQLTHRSVSVGVVPSPSAYHNFSSRQGKKLDIPLYTTYGTPEEFKVRGRVIEAEASESKATDNWMDNFRRTVHQLHAEDKEKLWVNISVLGQDYRVQTDQDGFFELDLKGNQPLQPGYYAVTAQLEPGQKRFYSEISHGKVVIQNPYENSTGIVSDIDDTLQYSHVTQKSKMVETLLFENPYSQVAVPGMAAFLSALDRHSDGRIDGDVNYVSGSPLNLAPRLETFLSIHGFPDGPLDLKFMGLGPNKDSPTEQIQYKLGKIRNIFETYPHRRFVLVGDSGEKDPEIYRQIAQEFPGRVQAIYIHNVTQSNPQDPRFEGMLAFSNADQAATDALARGLISAQDLQAVQQDVYTNAPLP